MRSGAFWGSRILRPAPRPSWRRCPHDSLIDESPCVSRWSSQYMLNQDDGVSPTRAPASPPSARARVPDLGWQARRRRPQAPWRARRRGSSFTRRVDPPDAAPRHLAHGAARLQPAQPALVPRHRSGAPDRWRSVRRPRRPVLGPRQPHPSAGRGAQSPRARPRDPGLLDPRRQGAQPDDGAQRPRVRRSLSRARAVHAHRGPPRHPLRAFQRAQARRRARRDLPARLRRSVLVRGRARPGVAGPDLAPTHGLEASGAPSRKRPATRTESATWPEWAGATDEPAGSVGRGAPTWCCRRRPRPGSYARAGSERGPEPQAAGDLHWGSDPARVVGRCHRRTRRVGRAELPGAAGARRASQAGPVTWGRVDVDAEVRADHECARSPPSSTSSRCAERYADVRARGEVAGAPTTDPTILPGFWVYATRDGAGSGREIARLVELHAAYRWRCGGVAVAYHRCNDFRSDHGDVFSELVTQLLARLMKHDLVDLHRVARDGTRIRASAGAASFRSGRPSSGSCAPPAPTSSRSPARRPTTRSRPATPRRWRASYRIGSRGSRTRSPHLPKPGHSDAVAAGRVRMGTDSAKQIYTPRAATAETRNAVRPHLQHPALQHREPVATLTLTVGRVIVIRGCARSRPAPAYTTSSRQPPPTKRCPARLQPTRGSSLIDVAPPPACVPVRRASSETASSPRRHARNPSMRATRTLRPAVATRGVTCYEWTPQVAVQASSRRFDVVSLRGHSRVTR